MTLKSPGLLPPPVTSAPVPPTNGGYVTFGESCDPCESDPLGDDSSLSNQVPSDGLDLDGDEGSGDEEESEEDEDGDEGDEDGHPMVYAWMKKAHIAGKLSRGGEERYRNLIFQK